MRLLAFLSFIALISLAADLAAADAATPVLLPRAGKYVAPLLVVAAPGPPGVTLRFTMDGSDPSESSWSWPGPLAITDTTTVRVRAFQPGRQPSAVASATYQIQFPLTTERPVFTPVSLDYTGPVAVTLATSTSGATIRFTTDGSMPTARSPIYTAPLAISATTTIHARAFAGRILVRIGPVTVRLPAVFPSGIASATYRITLFGSVATPTLLPPSGRYRDVVAAHASTATIGATIRYTLDGSRPEESSPELPASLSVERSRTLTVRGFAPGLTPSELSAQNYVLQVVEPTATPGGGQFTDGVRVELASGTAGATVRFTRDGGEPTEDSPSADGAIDVSTSGPLTARAFRDGWLPSEPITADFSFRVATPAISPPGGLFTGPVHVSALTTTSGAMLRYTLDGSNPDASSPVIEDSVEIDATATLTVIGMREGFAPSAPAVALYEIGAGLMAGFASPSLNTAESAGTVALAIVTSAPSTDSVVITYAIDVGSADSIADIDLPDDVELVDGSYRGHVTVEPGTRIAELRIVIRDDLIHEPLEHVRLRLVSSSHGAIDSANAEMDLGILDDDQPPAVSFSADTVTVIEDAGVARVPLTLSMPSGGTIAVEYRIRGGTMVLGVDYLSPGQRLSIFAGDDEPSIGLDLVDDSLLEGSEYVDIEIVAAEQATLGSRTRCRLVVVSDENHNVVVDWFARARGLVAAANNDPAAASRIYALLGVAQRRAARAAAADASVSTAGAVTAASWTILAGLFPAEDDALRQHALDAVGSSSWS
ncbi:MAG: chitobiase/beta-hexosaminidase C-terminal domain-containing protein, partial [Planctomycetes bacterium]|nr:chitobiase/beta-hexosaminidase C-terminal domain-containing protein [Planctomycetota bacterium]